MRRPWLGLLLALAVGCSGPAPKEAGTTPDSRPTVKVQTEKVQAVEENEGLELSGSCAPAQQANLSSRLSGRITYLRVVEGDHVARGEVLVRVDVSEVEARTREASSQEAVARAATSQALAEESVARAAVEQARANLALTRRSVEEGQSHLAMARADHQRFAFLHKEGAISRQKAEQSDTELKVAQARVAQLQAGVQQAQAALARAEASVAEARAGSLRSQAGVEQARSGVEAASVNLDYGQLLAPFDGVVTKKLAEEGEIANPGQPLLELQDVRNVQLLLEVPEEHLAKIRARETLSVRLDALKTEVPGRVFRIVPSGDATSRTFIVKLRLPNQQGHILPGMFGRVRLDTGRSKAVWVPAQALVQRGQLQGVFLADKDQAEFRLVTTGRTREQKVQIRSGLSGGEDLILSPLEQLSEGQKVSL